MIWRDTRRAMSIGAAALFVWVVCLVLSSGVGELSSRADDAGAGRVGGIIALAVEECGFGADCDRMTQSFVDCVRENSSQEILLLDQVAAKPDIEVLVPLTFARSHGDQVIVEFRAFHLETQQQITGIRYNLSNASKLYGQDGVCGKIAGELEKIGPRLAEMTRQENERKSAEEAVKKKAQEKADRAAMENAARCEALSDPSLRNYGPSDVRIGMSYEGFIDSSMMRGSTAYKFARRKSSSGETSEAEFLDAMKDGAPLSASYRVGFMGGERRVTAVFDCGRLSGLVISLGAYLRTSWDEVVAAVGSKYPLHEPSEEELSTFEWGDRPCISAVTKEPGVVVYAMKKSRGLAGVEIEVGYGLDGTSLGDFLKMCVPASSQMNLQNDSF